MTISRKTYLLSLMPVKKSVSVSPKRSRKSALARIVESPISSITMPVSRPASTSTAGSSRGATLAYQKSARAIATTDAIDADSVGVKTPLKIPPRMMNGIASTGSAARPVRPTVATPAKGRLTRKSIRRTTT